MGEPFLGSAIVINRDPSVQAQDLIEYPVECLPHSRSVEIVGSARQHRVGGSCGESLSRERRLIPVGTRDLDRLRLTPASKAGMFS